MKSMNIAKRFAAAGFEVKRDGRRYEAEGYECHVDWTDQSGDAVYIYVEPFRFKERRDTWSDTLPGFFCYTIKEAISVAQRYGPKEKDDGMDERFATR